MPSQQKLEAGRVLNLGISQHNIQGHRHKVAQHGDEDGQALWQVRFRHHDRLIVLPPADLDDAVEDIARR